MRRAWIVALTLCAACALPAASASARVACAYVDAEIPVLTAGNYLDVTLSRNRDVATVLRAGDEIKVRNGDGASVTCQGTAPTVANVDAIHIRQADPPADENTLPTDPPPDNPPPPPLKGAGGRIDLGGGQLAPGVTDEGNGSSEIEVTVDLYGPGNFTYVNGTAAADRIRFGMRNGEPAANLNPTVDGANADADLFASGIGFVGAVGRNGPDLLSAGGGSEFAGPLAGRIGFALHGGNGADVLLGHDGFDGFYGDSGPDVLRGYGGTDYLYGGDGADELFGSSGRDALIARDGDNDDRLSCGTGRDVAFLDRLDGRSSCEGLAPSSFRIPRLVLPGS
jgi:hypothetical protein